MAKKKVKRYKKLIIEHDCLVPKGAMQVESVFKEDGHFIKVKKPMVKFDDEKQMMYNVMVKWNKFDSEDWILDNEMVRTEALIDYMANGDKVLKFTHKKDEDKDTYEIDAHVLEIYTAKENDPYFPEEVGAILRGAYFRSKEDYDIVKEFKFESSIEGFAELEEYEIDVEKRSNGIKHKIKDLLKKIFPDLVLEKSVENDFLEILEKDFDSVLEDRKNTDLYYATSAFQTAIYNAEWKYLYGEITDVTGLKKEIAKITKQFMKYINAMTFEKVIKEVEEKTKGDAMENREEIQAMIDESLKPVIKSLGLEEGQTLADVVTKAIGESEPPKPVVVMKDSGGKDVEIDLVDLVKGLVTKVSELEGNDSIKKAELEAKVKKAEEDLVKLKKEVTDNAEEPDDHPEEKEIKKSDEERKASVAG